MGTEECGCLYRLPCEEGKELAEARCNAARALGDDVTHGAKWQAWNNATRAEYLHPNLAHAAARDIREMRIGVRDEVCASIPEKALYELASAGGLQTLLVNAKDAVNHPDSEASMNCLKVFMDIVWPQEWKEENNG